MKIMKTMANEELSAQAQGSKITLEWIEEQGWLKIDTFAWQDCDNGVILEDRYGWHMWGSAGEDNEDITIDFSVNSPEEYARNVTRLHIAQRLLDIV